MTTYIEFHALQTVPPSNINRDDSGAPKTAVYGGVTRSRVSSQSWKRAIREDFNEALDPLEVGTRSRMIVGSIATAIDARRPDLSDRAQDLAVAAMEAAGFKKPMPKTRRKGEPEGQPETGYLVFLSQRQIESLAGAAAAVSDEIDPKAAMQAAKVKQLVDADHSIDVALFGRMIADSSDLNVDAACQVAHAISVHEATPEYDFYTAVDDAKDRNEDEEDAGAGMMGTVAYISSTLYRYAAINVDQLSENLGSTEATNRAIEAFLRSFVVSMPSGKQTTFANGTRPDVVLVTVGKRPAKQPGRGLRGPVKAREGYIGPGCRGARGARQGGVLHLASAREGLGDHSCRPIMRRWPTVGRGPFRSTCSWRTRWRPQWGRHERPDAPARLAAAELGCVQPFHPSRHGVHPHQERDSRAAGCSSGASAQRLHRGPAHADPRGPCRPARRAAPRLPHRPPPGDGCGHAAHQPVLLERRGIRGLRRRTGARARGPPRRAARPPLSALLRAPLMCA